jgi:phosphohistidine phosphatase
MKTLLIIRHAKSSWLSDAENDFDRPLNERGKKEAPEMAKRLHKRIPDIACLISSPARRARKTAKYFAQEFGLTENDIRLVPELYYATTEAFFDVVSSINNFNQLAAIFSHNPGITEFVNLLTNNRIDNMPTSGIFAIRISIENWNDFRKGVKEFFFFDYPKL